ncbi:MAG: hypothetical protein H7096_11155 [Flavobacterium sp.]|nr:hypothetical protein [Pedobacter sp.]
MLKYIFTFVMLIHGLIHFMGFAKAFNYANITQITKYISKPAGSLWLLTAILFFVAVLLFLLKKESWPYIAIVAAVISQILIVTVWKDAKFGTILNIIILFIAIASWATYQFEAEFKADVKRHIDQTDFSSNDLLTEVDIASLPTPVQKYIRYTGAINKPKVKNMKIVFDGEMREKGKDFFKFQSVQYNFFDDPTRLFFMKAKMVGIPVPGYHCYQNERATMQIKLLGLFNVVNIEGVEMNKAETVTVFNDMCLMAPAALIDKRIEWTPIDSLSAKATFTNGVNRITAILYFNERGQLINFTSDDRYAISVMKRYRFSTPVKEYTQMNGRNIWKYGDAVWHYPEGEFVYGKFTLKSIECNVEELQNKLR